MQREGERVRKEGEMRSGGPTIYAGDAAMAYLSGIGRKRLPHGERVENHLVEAWPAFGWLAG
jgi:hypothetical protein